MRRACWSWILTRAETGPCWYWREAVRDHLGAPLCEVRTGSGGLHLYYRCDQPVGNRNWEGGEIRCEKGYAVLWDEDAVLAALEQIDLVEPVDVSQWPIGYKPEKRQRRGERLAGPDRAGAIGVAGHPMPGGQLR